MALGKLGGRAHIDEAVELANSTAYGLSAMAFTSSSAACCFARSDSRCTYADSTASRYAMPPERDTRGAVAGRYVSGGSVEMLLGFRLLAGLAGGVGMILAICVAGFVLDVTPVMVLCIVVIGFFTGLEAAAIRASRRCSTTRRWCAT